MGNATRAIGILFAAALCTEASAQLFKCKGPDGKIVYSDTRCEAAASGSALKVIPNSSTDPNAPAAPKGDAAAKGDPAAKADVAPKAFKKGAESVLGVPGPAQDAPRESSGRDSGELSYSDRERIRNLEMTLSSSGATNEQKEGAQLEISSIRSGREARMSRDDRDLRDSLAVDLGSVDRKKRNEALRRIRDVYYR